jgi:hypothetical protein
MVAAHNSLGVVGRPLDTTLLGSNTINSPKAKTAPTSFTKNRLHPKPAPHSFTKNRETQKNRSVFSTKFNWKKKTDQFFLFMDQFSTNFLFKIQIMNENSKPTIFWFSAQFFYFVA